MAGFETWNWPLFLDQFTAAAQQQGFEKEVLAITDAGPLVAWRRPNPGPVVYLSAGIHGDEPAGPLALLAMLERDLLRPDVHWLICPALNPEGLRKGTRQNDAGMDLNRDYLVQHAATTQAHAEWINRQPVPDCFLSLHEDWETDGFYFYEINLQEDRPPRAEAILQAVAPWLEIESAVIIDDHQTRSKGWIHHVAEADVPKSWPEAIYMAKRGCPVSFTFETPSKAHLGDRVAAHLAAVDAALREVLA